MRVVKGGLAAALRFIVVGIAAPFALTHLSGAVSGYVKLPPNAEIWEVFILFGALFALMAFLENGFSKGEYPWLGGKIGGGLTSWGFYYYIFLLIPSGMSSETGAQISATGLLVLIFLGIVFSYGYIVLDFFDYRRRRFGKPGTESPTPG